MIDYNPFLAQLKQHGLGDWVHHLPAAIHAGLSVQRYGDLPRWLTTLHSLPDWPVSNTVLDSAVISIDTEKLPSQQLRQSLKQQLLQLCPWRKGPFDVFGVTIDTEWRSDWKWQRLIGHIEPLAGRRVLDIGTGNGYHCWRMRGAGASLVVGIDPAPLSIVQFWVLQRYLQDHAMSVLPLAVQQLPPKLQYFDTTFSMGVLYHRRDPDEHLRQLRSTLRDGGQLVLETLIVAEGAIKHNESGVLVPQQRYAGMRNVWHLPTCRILKQWLLAAGFDRVDNIDVSTTTTQEQRATEWTTNHSLAQCLDPADTSRTIEGYPAPKRAIFTAVAV